MSDYEVTLVNDNSKPSTPPPQLAIAAGFVGAGVLAVVWLAG